MATKKTTVPAKVEKNATVTPAETARRPGRPAGSARGPEQRNRLLDTALVLFARQGILDTTLVSIAREAKVTPAMVNYYFTSRDQLIDVLIDERFLPVKAALSGVFQEYPDDPVAAITELARRFMDVATRYPWFAPLWLRGVITHDDQIRQRMGERVGDEDRKAALRCIKRWQREGMFNADLEPPLVFLSLLGLTILPLATSMTRQLGTERNPIDAAAIARHAIALLVHGVGPQKPMK